MDLHEELKRHFGYDAFRKGQEEVVRAVLSGRPSIAILPTGAGKSLCYQLPAMLLTGTTIVVSPLVALMKDQVDALRARGISAAYINSSLSESERQQTQNALRRGEYRLVYVAPERFKSPSFLSAIAGVKVPLLAVDEAHCISAWGHDFRPEYQKLALARDALKAERILALTATATPEVRRDIADALELTDPLTFVAGFDRPNLFIEVLRAAGDKDKLGRLVALARGGGPGLVYAATRKNVEKIVAALQAAGIDALAYHAGLGDEERTSVQEKFIRGDTAVVVATNAFGMGVDKANIRYVVHFDTPRSLEAYYQEIGRAGRDGQPAYALLLFNFADVMMQRRMIDAGRPSRKLVEDAWEAGRRLKRGSLEELARECNVSASELSGAVRLLESAGHFERRSREGQFACATPSVAAQDLNVDFELLELRVARERQMLDRMVRFADTRGCRRHNLLRYFGDMDSPRSCSSCDSCTASRAPEPEKLKVAAPPRKKKREEQEQTPVEELPYNEAVFEKLRAMRTEIARDTKVPPYVIFHDRTLRELARALPYDEKSFIAVKGAGQQKWEKYGERVLRVTAAARKPGGSGVAKDSAQPPPSWSDAPQPPTSWTEAPQPPTSWTQAPPPQFEEPRQPPPVRDEALWKLCAEGATLGELALRLSKPTAEIASMLADGVRRGKAIDAGQLLGRERCDAIREAAKGSSGDLVALRKRLSFPMALAEIRLALI